ncbi:MAG: YjcQ family protein [Lachnospiraceae bacterium]
MDEKLKRKIICSILNEFKNKNRKINYESYNIKYNEFVSILHYMNSHNLIKNVSFARAGNEPMIAFYDDAEITDLGIEYLQDSKPIKKLITKYSKFIKPTGKFLAWLISTIITLAGVAIAYLEYIKPN